jgi:hypothetical protein
MVQFVGHQLGSLLHVGAGVIVGSKEERVPELVTLFLSAATAHRRQLLGTERGTEHTLNKKRKA